MIIQGKGYIKGGLPVIATLDCGNDSWTGEGYAEVRDIYWRKKNGERGSLVPARVRDEALAYDPGFSFLVESVLYDHAFNQMEDYDG